MKTSYCCVIFDLDDTLLHLDVAWDSMRTTVLSALETINHEHRYTRHLSMLCDMASTTSEIKSQLDGIFEYYELQCVRSRSYMPFHEYLSLARDIKACGLGLAIASSNHSRTISLILDQLDIHQLFDFICGRDMVTRNKPAPDQLLLVLKAMGIEQQAVLFVGDSDNDRDAAKAAGIDFFRVTTGNSQDAIRLRRILCV